MDMTLFSARSLWTMGQRIVLPDEVTAQLVPNIIQVTLVE
jgi:hypothetical protein